MGRDNALLDFKGRTFLSRAVAALRDGGCARVYVVVRRDHAEVDAEARATGAVVLTNPVTDRSRPYGTPSTIWHRTTRYRVWCGFRSTSLWSRPDTSRS